MLPSSSFVSSSHEKESFSPFFFQQLLPLSHPTGRGDDALHPVHQHEQPPHLHPQYPGIVTDRQHHLHTEHDQHDEGAGDGPAEDHVLYGDHVPNTEGGTRNKKNPDSLLEVAVCQLSQQVPHCSAQDQPELLQVLHLHIHGGGGHLHRAGQDQGIPNIINK